MLNNSLKKSVVKARERGLQSSFDRFRTAVVTKYKSKKYVMLSLSKHDRDRRPRPVILRSEGQKNLSVLLTNVMRSKRFFPVRMTTVFIILSFLFLSCDIPEEVYDNPLDLETNQEQGITPPALVFAPNDITVTVGSSISVEVYALEVSNVAGSHIQVSYDKNKLSLTSVSLGTFFASGEDPIFFYENDGSSGTVDIYTSYLGTETSVSGTGTLAYLVFSATAPGQSMLSYSTSCELVDPDDNPITLNGLGEGVVNAN